MSGKVNHLKDELRRTFTLYALIPTFLIFIIILVLAFVYWNTNVLERNRSTLQTASEKLNVLISDYLNEANEVAALCDISQLRDNNAVRAKMYENLHQFINHTGVQAQFYLLDAKLNRLISSQIQEPEPVELGKIADWGIIGQMKQKPVVPVFAFFRVYKEY